MATDTQLAILIAVILGGIVLWVWWGRRRLTAPSRQIDQWIEEIRSGKKPSVPERTHFDHELLVKSETFIVREVKTKRELEIRWEEIQASTAFKRDLLSTDQVCIAFQLNKGALEVNEEMKGFADFCTAMAEKLPGSIPWTEWYMNVTTPAFELCVTPIFQRSQESTSGEESA
jgi:hypothetical protein